MRNPLVLPPVTRAAVIALVAVTLANTVIKYKIYMMITAAQATNDNRDPNAGIGGTIPPMAIPFSQIKVAVLTLNPHYFLQAPWTLLLAPFMETQVVPFALSLWALLFGGRYYEHVMGSKELLNVLALNALLPTTAALALAFAVAAPASDQINGGYALQACFLVIFKQLVPEHTIILFRGPFKAQVKYIVVPVMLLYSLVLAATVGGPAVVLLWGGFFTTWTYLRFYKVSFVDPDLPTSLMDSRVPVRGDSSDTFAFAEFFYPQPVHDAVAVVADAVFGALVAVSLCRPFSPEDVEQSNQRSIRRTSGGGNTEADRRRALALKQLEERLSQSQGAE